MMENVVDKIRVKVLSDQHLEFRRFLEHKYFKAMHSEYSDDLLIVAGDLEVIHQSSLENFIQLCDKHKQVIYVPGNHDYYSSTWEPVERILRSFELQIGNLKILRSGDVFEYAGRRFLGDTMWVRDTPELHMRSCMINDPYQIADCFNGIRERNTKFVEFLHTNLRSGDIVVTHHLPSKKSTPIMFLNSPSQPWFVCDMEPLILERSPAAWIHGHTHARTVYKIGETSIICNPVGYPSENSSWSNLEPSIFEI